MASSSAQSEKFLFRARVPADRYRTATDILDRLGMTPQDAFNMLLAQITLHRGLPFTLADPDDAPLIPGRELAKRWNDSLGEYDWTPDSTETSA